MTAGVVDGIRACAAGPMPFRLVGAHDGLTARLGVEAGFDGLWAGSLEISASHGVPDDGRLALEQVVERVEEMVRTVPAPVLVDVDIGLGDAVATVEEFERCGAAGVVIEDQAWPKINSLEPVEHRLEPVDSFCAVLETAVGHRKDDAFAIIARIEALVAGGSPSEAIARAHAYLNAGVDALVVHSNRPSGDDVVAVLRALPSVAVGVIPTVYPQWTAAALHDSGAAS